MSDSILALPATGERLLALRDAGVLSEAAYGRALALSHATLDARRWRLLATRAALVLGALLCLAGAVFFVAANWADMSRWTRLGVIETGVVLCAAAALAARASLSRQMALALAAALIGPLLAVFGQTYQTGADPWELFALWAVLATPFAVAARFAPLWLGIAGLINLAISLWCVQVRLFAGTNEYAYSSAVVGALDALGWLAVSLVRRWRGAGWPTYPTRALATLAVLVPLPEACDWLMHESYAVPTPWAAACVAQVGLICAGLLALELWGALRSDRYRSSLLGFAGCALVSAWLWSFPWLRDQAWLLALLVLVAVTLAAVWIRRSGRRQQEASHVGI